MKLNTIPPRLKEVDTSRGIKTIEQLRRERKPLKLEDIRTQRWTKSENGRLLPLNSKAWHQLRRSVLAEEPLCRHCAAQGLTVPATEVDHMRGAADNSRDALQALCKPCHSIKTMAELYGRPARMGCDTTGNPADPLHHWNKASMSRPDASALPSCAPSAEKSPAADGHEPTCIPSFNANCESQP